MSIYKFKEEEIFVNVLKMYPKYEFIAYDGKVYINNQVADSGSFVAESLCVPSGYISLYEKNIDKLSGSNNFIYPFITKDGSLSCFSTISANAFSNTFAYGDIITGSYPMSSSLYRNYYVAGSSGMANRKYMEALRNTFNHYILLSPHYEYKNSSWDKDTQEANLISIPSIFYGSKIKKGSVNLKFYVSGTLIGELQDKNKNGELIQVGPVGSQNSGSVAGVVLYTEGFFLLTGSWELHATERDYLNDVNDKKTTQWVHFGASIEGHDVGTITGSHSYISFQGETYTPVISMYAHAPKGQLNHSNNPTFLQAGESLYTASLTATGSLFLENSGAIIKNTVYSPYDNNTEPFKKHTYISSIGIYDDEMQLIGVAKVAKPVKKTEEREFSFKLKIDI